MYLHLFTFKIKKVFTVVEIQSKTWEKWKALEIS